MLQVLRQSPLRSPLLSSHHLYSAQAAHTDWTRKFEEATTSIKSNVSYMESADQLRRLTQTDLIKGTDIRDHPEKFFEAHRILARHALEHGPGFWIRFTVHYNLFAGTILAVGTDEQVDKLAEYQSEGILGCFSLTEKLAGVQSGLVVETTAKWDEVKQLFILNTPHEGARKNWISQGFVADKTVVLADLIVGGKSMGPHAFVMDFRVQGKLVEGITVDDMGPKTVGNDLDNAWISFDNVELPPSALLSRHAGVENGPNGAVYVLKSKDIRPFDMIGQRLYTGRIAVAQAALEYRKHLFQRTKAYSDQKSIYSEEPSVLSDIPQLQALYEESSTRLTKISEFAAKCEMALSRCLRNGEMPSQSLVEAIATCKVLAVEDSINACFRLKQEVGSYALMDSSGFKNLDFLQCCKFAEGDSRILMQKLARDEFKRYLKDPKLAECLWHCEDLAKKLSAHVGTKEAAWKQEWEAVYALAGAVMEKVQEDFDP